MSEWWACISGALALPAAAQKKWRALTVDPASYADWPWPKAIDPSPTKVSKLLGELQKSERFGTKLFVTESTRGVALRARFTSETNFRVQSLVLALRAAEGLGAKGRFVIVSASEPPLEPPLRGAVWALDIDHERSRFRELRGSEKTRANADPELFALLFGFDEEVELRPSPGTRRQARAAEKRAALTSSQSKSAFISRVAKKLTTDAAIAAAEQLLERVESEPDAADTLWKAWKLLRARTPRAGTREALLDREKKLRVQVGKALVRLERPHVDDKRLRDKLAAATRKEWPEPRVFLDALDALAKSRKR